MANAGGIMTGDQPRVTGRDMAKDTRTSGDMQYKNYSRAGFGQTEARSLARPMSIRAPRRA